MPAPLLSIDGHPREMRSYGILSTYPPTPCGIATFSAALGRGLLANGASLGIVEVTDELDRDNPLVAATLRNGDPLSVSGAAAALDRFDVAIVQHEYGLYGGRDGEEVVDIVRALTVPSIVVAHTVLEHPTAHQRQVLEAVIDAAGAIVVMTEAGRRRLAAMYDADLSKVAMISHGAAVPVPTSHDTIQTRSNVSTLLTWGLLGPGKGIEWAIDALARLQDLRPLPRYMVAGATHPKVAAKHGEAYRNMIKRRAVAAGVDSQLTFDPTYRDVPSLVELIRSASVVVLPYDSPDQVTSGVLVDALAAGTPVVATSFPHAVEALSTGAGLVVPRRDPDALAAALRRVLTEPGLLVSMAAEARRLAPELSWPAVAGRYDNLGRELLMSKAASV